MTAFRQLATPIGLAVAALRGAAPTGPTSWRVAAKVPAKGFDGGGNDKHSAGRGRPTPFLVVMTAEVFTELAGAVATLPASIPATEAAASP